MLVGVGVILDVIDGVTVIVGVIDGVGVFVGVTECVGVGEIIGGNKPSSVTDRIEVAGAVYVPSINHIVLL